MTNRLCEREILLLTGAKHLLHFTLKMIPPGLAGQSNRGEVSLGFPARVADPATRPDP